MTNRATHGLRHRSISSRRGRRLGGLALIVATVLAACGGVDESSTTDAPSVVSAAPTTESPETTAPPVDSGDDGGDDSGSGGTAVAETTPATEAVATTETATTEPAVEAVSGGSITVAIDGDSSGFSPQLDAWGNGGHIVARAIFDTLAVYAADGTVAPYLAESFTANEDSTVWTIAVRPGISFHNGEPLDAEAVRLNFEAILASPTMKGQFALVTGVRVVDEMTVEIEMSKPWGAFPNVLTGGLAGQAGYIAAPAMLANPDGSRSPIGTGPFVFSEWIPDDHLSVERNESYWQQPAYLDSVEFRPIADSNARKDAFDAGDVDVYFTGSSKEINEYLGLRDAGEVTVTLAPPSQPDVLLLNTTKAPLDDVRVRQAMQLSIDFDRIFGFVEGLGVKEVMHGPYPDSSFWFVDTGYPDYDLDRAKALVEEYEAEVGPITIEYSGGQDAFVVSYMELIQSMWKDAGIDTDIVSRAQGENISAVLAFDYQVTGWGGVGGDDPDNDYAYFHSGTSNFTGFSDPAIDAAMDAGRALSDPDERKEQYAIVQQILTDNMPYIWMGTVQFGVITRGDVLGVENFVLPDGSPGQPLVASRFYLNNVWVQP